MTNPFEKPEQQEQATLRYDQDLDNLEILHARYIKHRFAPHAHETYAIGVIQTGAGAFTLRGTSYVVPAHTIFFLHPDEIHDGYAATSEGWSYRMIYPSCETVLRIVKEIDGHASVLPRFRTPVSSEVTTVGRLERFHRILEQPGDPLERETYLRWLILALVEQYATQPLTLPQHTSEPRAIALIRAYLEEHCVDPISLEVLANLVQLHPSYLIRSFHKTMGLPPHAYLIHMRIRKAKQLLREGVEPAFVAQSVGFADQSHLTRHFRRIVGLTPARFARMSKMF